MEIINNIEINDLSLHLKKENILVFSDLHIGYEEYLNVKGILVPRFQFAEMYERAKKIINNRRFKAIVITGDLKHEFGVISDTEWRNTLKLIDLFLQHSEKLVLVKGNHDITLKYIASKRHIDLVEYFKINDIIICHGDEILTNDAFHSSKIIIIGHEHPAVSLKDKSKYELYKCFIKGKYKNKILIVTPSFNALTIGTNILKQELLSPFLHQDLSNFEVFIVEDSKVYDFGKVKNL
ncbi:MAG TPA: metallophosphoesterase [Candidatus Nanoarchaeia archaeon]|nr:metallophosphoesterase [Candidatus Nanoarchaeia archaeon]